MRQTLDQEEFADMMVALRTTGGCACGTREGQERRSSKADAAMVEAEAKLITPLFQRKSATSDPGRCVQSAFIYPMQTGRCRT